RPVHRAPPWNAQIVGGGVTPAGVAIATIRREAPLAKDRIGGGIGQRGVILQHPAVSTVRHVEVARRAHCDSPWIAHVVSGGIAPARVVIAMIRREVLEL